MRALILPTVLALAGTPIGCDSTPPAANVRAEIEDVLDRFHAADTTMNAEAVIDLLWPEFTMLVDGERVSFDDVAAGSRAFMATLDLFHTEWSDVQIVPLGADHAVSSFLFRDSIRTEAGELLRSRGPTTLVWERRGGEWRAIHGDADHYPIEGG